MTVVVVKEIANPARYEARVAGRLVVRNSSTPFLDAARVLLGEGCANDSGIVMRRSPDGMDCLISTVGMAARLTVDQHHMVFARWKAPRCSEGSSPVASNTFEPPLPPRPRNRPPTKRAA